jgi:hypothetical protein
MTLRLNGSTSGYTEIDAPAVAGSNTLVLPTGNGSAGNILGTDGSGNLSWVNGRMVLATAQNSTSGTSIDFTGIPSWVKRVTVMLNGVSTSGSSNLLVQLGTSSGIVSSGYNSLSVGLSTSGGIGGTSSTAGYLVQSDASSATRSGHLIATVVSGNIWVSSHTLKFSSTQLSHGGGDASLSGTLDRVRITTVNGTDTFDAGSINILYEG